MRRGAMAPTAWPGNSYDTGSAVSILAWTKSTSCDISVVFVLSLFACVVFCVFALLSGPSDQP